VVTVRLVDGVRLRVFFSRGQPDSRFGKLPEIVPKGLSGISSVTVDTLCCAG